MKASFDGVAALYFGSKNYTSENGYAFVSTGSDGQIAPTCH